MLFTIVLVLFIYFILCFFLGARIGTYISNKLKDIL
jgi:uncharacterized protein YneF (UPF0154 family)